MVTYRHWSVFLWRHSDDVSHCRILSRQNWIAAYLGYTLRMKMLFRGWPVMVHDTHVYEKKKKWMCLVPGLQRAGPAWHYKIQWNSEKLKQNRAEVDVKKCVFRQRLKALAQSVLRDSDKRVPCGWSSHIECSPQTWTIFSVLHSQCCRRSGDELGPAWFVSASLMYDMVCLVCAISELICAGSDSEPAASVGQSVPDWHGHMVTGPEWVVWKGVNSYVSHSHNSEHLPWVLH